MRRFLILFIQTNCAVFPVIDERPWDSLCLYVCSWQLLECTDTFAQVFQNNCHTDIPIPVRLGDIWFCQYCQTLETPLKNRRVPIAQVLHTNCRLEAESCEFISSHLHLMWTEFSWAQGIDDLVLRGQFGRGDILYSGIFPLSIFIMNPSTKPVWNQPHPFTDKSQTAKSLSSK